MTHTKKPTNGERKRKDIRADYLRMSNQRLKSGRRKYTEAEIYEELEFKYYIGDLRIEEVLRSED